MKLSFAGVLNDNEAFIDADTGETDREDRQATEPVRLREGGAPPLSPNDMNKLREMFYDYKNPSSKSAMLRGVGVPDDEIKQLLGDSAGAWETYRERLQANREAKWNERDKPQPHLGLWGFRRRVVKVEDWEGSAREEVITRVKHFVLSNEVELARLKGEVERFERFENSPSVSREPIPEDVQAFVWRRDGGRCVKCGSQERLEFDHVIPLAKGGSNTERNIQLLCEFHNRMKGVGDLLFPEIAEEES